MFVALWVQISRLSKTTERMWENILTCMTNYTTTYLMYLEDICNIELAEDEENVKKMGEEKEVE